MQTFVGPRSEDYFNETTSRFLPGTEYKGIWRGSARTLLSLQSKTSAAATFQSIIAILSQLCDLSLPFATEGMKKPQNNIL